MRGDRGAHTSPRYRLFARGFNSVLPTRRVHERVRARAHTHAHTRVQRRGPSLADTVNVYLHGTTLFFIIRANQIVKKISNERIFRRSEDVTRNCERSAWEEFCKLEA